MRPFAARVPDGPVTEPVLGPTNGSISGWLGVALAVGLGVLAATDLSWPAALRVVLGCLLAIALIWTYLLRPRVVLRTDGLLLRNAFVDAFVPYGRIERVLVRSATNVVVHGGRRYVGTGVGRSLHRMVRTDRTSRPGASANKPFDVADYLEERVAERIREAEPGTGVVRRAVAWPEAAVSAVLAAALLAAFLG